MSNQRLRRAASSTGFWVAWPPWTCSLLICNLQAVEELYSWSARSYRLNITMEWYLAHDIVLSTVSRPMVLHQCHLFICNLPCLESLGSRALNKVVYFIEYLSEMRTRFWDCLVGMLIYWYLISFLLWFIGHACNMVQVGQALVWASWSSGGYRDKATFYLPSGSCFRGRVSDENLFLFNSFASHHRREVWENFSRVLEDKKTKCW